MILLAIAVVVVASRLLADRLRVPEAVVLVVFGLAAGFLPFLPTVQVAPEVVLLGFLPPLIYHAAFFSAPRETRADAVPIITLAFGLTTVTCVAVACTVHWLFPAVGWPAAFAFGAAVAPTDAVAATSVLQRLGAPPRLVTILEGESLINDGVALTIFGLAVESLSTPFTWGHGTLRLLEVVLGGVAFGLLVGWAVRWGRRWIRDPSSQLIISLTVPYLAYVPAEHLGVSGVLATVVAGFSVGTDPGGMLQPSSRLVGQLFWRMLIFLLESALFVLLGLEIREVLRDPGPHSWSYLLISAAIVAAVLIVVRLGWQLGNAPLARLVPGGARSQEGLRRQERVVVGMSGLRGAISLALALSLPAAVGVERGVLIFLAAVVVLITLVGQVPLLPVLLRRFGMVETDRQRLEVVNARKVVMEAALARLDELAADDEIDEQTASTFRQMYELRLDRMRSQLDEEESADQVPDTRPLRAQLLKAQRAKLDTLYRRGKISADTMRRVAAELDFEDPRNKRAVSP